MSSYYDDPDFADEYRRRDEEAISWAIEEKERNAMTDLKTGDSIPISLADLVRAKIGDELYIQIKDKKIPVRCKISSVDSDTMATLTVLPKGTITPPTMPID